MKKVLKILFQNTLAALFIIYVLPVLVDKGSDYIRGLDRDSYVHLWNQSTQNLEVKLRAFYEKNIVVKDVSPDAIKTLEEIHERQSNQQSTNKSRPVLSDPNKSPAISSKNKKELKPTGNRAKIVDYTLSLLGKVRPINSDIVPKKGQTVQDLLKWCTKKLIFNYHVALYSNTSTIKAKPLAIPTSFSQVI